MVNNVFHQYGTVSCEDVEAIKKQYEPYTKRLKLIKVLILCAVVVYIITMLGGAMLPLQKTKEVDIEFSELTADSELGSFCRVESISSVNKLFGIDHTIYRDGVSVGSSSTDVYFLATDSNGYVFLICADQSKYQSLFESLEGKSVYGKVMSPPENVIPSIHSALNGGVEAVEKELELTRKLFETFKILELTHQTTKTVNDGYNIGALIIRVICIIARLGAIGLVIAYFVIKKKHVKMVQDAILALRFAPKSSVDSDMNDMNNQRDSDTTDEKY